jgi:uncharacterized protein YegP (UPF0339 family)
MGFQRVADSAPWILLEGVLTVVETCATSAYYRLRACDSLAPSTGRAPMHAPFAIHDQEFTMAASFELLKNDQGHFHFSLKGADGGTLLRSETYEAKPSAENGIASVKKNSLLAERFERMTASDGRAYFNLKAANHQIVGTSPMFAKPETRDAALAAVQAHAEQAPVHDHSA